MEETTNKSGMSTGMIIGIAVIVAIVFGGGTYAYVNNKAEKEKKDLNAQITELQDQVSSAKDDSVLLLTLCQSNNPGTICAVKKIEGNFAKGTSSSTSGAGANWYARKTSGVWALVANGSGSYGFQDDPACSKTSDFPKSIVPTCGDY